ncbi:hypothetical protein HK103_006471 [Boothiomyces macroporosus]|uniref:Thioredoxin domain-containing protein n=1 Tax=Boothiomyces macroporosus TaxID=261099 RepID=A0AAD5UM26_9FUNG|nr:hypothetical protein HK103_006471 [Boothiomyces macroporosus]
MQVWLLTLISFALATTSDAIKKAYEEADPQLFKLSTSNFKSSVASGNWLVFYGAKWCGEYVKENKYNINIAKVECTVDTTLCEKIDGYPYIEQIENGESKGEVDREIDHLKSIAKSFEASKSGFVKLQEYIDEQTKPDSTVNPKGELLFLTDDLFKSMTNKKPWLLVFFAPWVTIINLVWKICKEYGVDGYPTIFFANEPDTRARFKGGRQLANLEDFALSFVNEPSFVPIQASGIPEKIKSNEVALFYVFDDDKDLENVVRVSKQVKTKIPFFICPDKKGFKELKVKGNSMVIVKDGGISQAEYSGDLSDIKKVSEWILLNRFAMAPVLDADSQEHLIMQSEYLIITVVDPNSAQGKEAILQLKKTATSWHEENPSETKVRFTYIDGIQFDHYTKQVYGISPDELPRFVVTKPHDDLYWDAHQTGQLYTINKKSYYLALEEARNNLTSPKSTKGFIGKMFYNIKKFFIFISSSWLNIILAIGATKSYLLN